MATKSCQAQAPAMPGAAERRGGGAGANRAPAGGTTPPPRRGQIKEKIMKDVVAAVSNIAAGFIRTDKNGGGGLLVADNGDGK